MGGLLLTCAGLLSDVLAALSVALSVCLNLCGVWTDRAEVSCGKAELTELTTGQTTTHLAHHRDTLDIRRVRHQTDGGPKAG